jgi:methionyl-tRNA formyltransferase
MRSDRRVLLIGQGITTLTALQSLLDRFHVVGLVRSSDAGDAAVRLANSADVPLFTDTSLSGVERAVRKSAPDAVVVSSYDRILPAHLVASRPFVNVHYAPLPRYRGRATVNWAIINGDPACAISIHSLVPGVDAGGILFQQSVPIGPSDTVTYLYRRLNEIQRSALGDAVARRLKGDEGKPQDESHATYACTRLPEDGEIDWSAPTAAADRLVRALTDPFPGAFTWLGLRRLVIRRAEPVREPRYEGRVPGRVVRVDRAAGAVEVLTGDGVLRLHEVALDGAGPQRAADVITSVRQTLGLTTTQLVAALEPRETDRGQATLSQRRPRPFSTNR